MEWGVCRLYNEDLVDRGQGGYCTVAHYTAYRMKKGKINLLSFEDDEDAEVNFVIPLKERKPPHKTKTNTVNFDLSQIRDRVNQMEMNEEIILEGEAAAAIEGEGERDSLDEEDDAEMMKRIKEAKQKRSLLASGGDNMMETGDDDYIPITTKSEYWLTRDTRESEEAFNKSDSRLVREDLFNEREVDDPTGSFTNFIGTAASGRRGLMMTSKMLERDIKTDLYDLEIGGHDKSGEDSDSDLDLEGDWERGQVLKGIEKGWNSTENEASFYSKQAKLKQFIPPPKFPTSSLVIEAPIDTTKMEENVEKISRDSKQLETRIDALKSEMNVAKSNLNELTELEIFFTDFSHFLSEKFIELREIEETNDRERWIHFFDNSPEEFLNLPEIIGKAVKIGLTSAKTLSELSGIFVKYHFLWADPKDIWETSGLKEVFSTTTTTDLVELFREIYVNDLDKFERIKDAIFE